MRFVYFVIVKPPGSYIVTPQGWATPTRAWACAGQNFTDVTIVAYPLLLLSTIYIWMT